MPSTSWFQNLSRRMRTRCASLPHTHEPQSFRWSRESFGSKNEKKKKFFSFGETEGSVFQLVTVDHQAHRRANIRRLLCVYIFVLSHRIQSGQKSKIRSCLFSVFLGQRKSRRKFAGRDNRLTNFRERKWKFGGKS